ncbi:MAG: glycosyltransferase family 2 protein [Candidatus Helarchaeota archaeon]|nr:glycosyltransferase family 2 protein [Candidatus Helarchaeota archaeon]
MTEKKTIEVKDAKDVELGLLDVAKPLLFTFILSIALFTLCFIFLPSVFYAFELVGLIFFILGLSYGTIFGITSICIRYKPPPSPLSEHPKVSIVISVFNDGDVLNNSLKRMADLEYPNYDIYVVYSTKSTDNTEEVAQKFAVKYNHIHALSEDISKGNACNVGIQNTDASYILFLDADNFIKKGFLEYAVETLVNEPNLCCVQARPIGVNADDSRTRLTWVGTTYNAMANEGICKILKSAMYGGYGGTWRRQALEDVKGFRTDVVSEDGDINCRFLAHQPHWRFKYDPKLRVYEYYPVSLTATYLAYYRWARATTSRFARNLKYIFSTGSVRNSISIFITNFFISLGIITIFFAGLPIVQFFTSLVFRLPQTSNYAIIFFTIIPFALIVQIIIFTVRGISSYGDILSKKTIVFNSLISILFTIPFVGIVTINALYDMIRRKKLAFVKTTKPSYDDEEKEEGEDAKE